MMNSDISAHPDTEPLAGCAATHCCASASWHLGSSRAVQLGFHSKPHLAFSSAVFFSVLGSLLLCFPFLPHPAKATNQKATSYY